MTTERRRIRNPRLLFAAGLLCITAQIYAQTPGIVNLSTQSPLSGSVIIDKRPVLDCTLNASYSRGDILVMLDGIDITALLEWKDDGFSYRPPTVLPSGQHNLQIVVGGEANAFAFETQHSEHYKTIQTDIDLAGEYSYAFTQDDNRSSRSSIDASLGINAHAETQRWDTMFTSHLQYTDSNRNVEQSGSVVLNDFLFRSRYAGDELGTTLEIGDVSIYESEMTLSHFSRRGVQFNMQYKGITLNTFSVLGDTTYDFDGGLGVGVDTAKNIYGASLASSFLSGRARLKLIYAKGGVQNTGIGIGSEPTAQEGDVVGVYAEADLIEELLALQAEWDQAKFDSDTGDTVAATKDRAFKVGAGGTYGPLQYHLYHTRVGANYTPISNVSLVNDKTGFGADAGLYGETQSLNVVFSRLHDNIDDDAWLPTVYTGTGSVNYTYFGLEQWQFFINYARTTQKSEDEPAGTDAVETDQDDISGTVQYMAGAWTHVLVLHYGINDDRVTESNDTRTFESSFSPTYAPGTPYLSSIAPTFSYLRETHEDGVLTSDTFALSLSLAGTLDGAQWRYMLNGTAQRKVYDEGTTPDETSYNVSARMDYLFAAPAFWMRQPSVGIKADYRKTDGANTSADAEVYALQLFVNLPLTYSF